MKTLAWSHSNIKSAGQRGCRLNPPLVMTVWGAEPINTSVREPTLTALGTFSVISIGTCANTSVGNSYPQAQKSQCRPLLWDQIPHWHWSHHHCKWSWLHLYGLRLQKDKSKWKSARWLLTGSLHLIQSPVPQSYLFYGTVCGCGRKAVGRHFNASKRRWRSYRTRPHKGCQLKPVGIYLPSAVNAHLLKINKYLRRQRRVKMLPWNSG